MSATTVPREERAARLADLRAREAARKIVLRGKPLMELPLEQRVAFAAYDPGAIVPRGDDYQEPLHRWQARAITYVLDVPEEPSRPEKTQLGVREDGRIWHTQNPVILEQALADGTLMQRTVRFGPWTEVSS
ncbi:hypothetical protein ACIGMX_34825 [Streptomyces aquilus]|uniref:hypothetical protein n=1 Tax=Streptomyces aquilus TaxID=2548456 RepID=UPI0037D5D7E4